MQTNLEQVTDMIRALPLEDFDKLREVVDEAERQKRSNGEEKEAGLQRQLERYKKARRWLDEHSAEYMNQWVCLEGSRLIAHSADGRDLYQIAREAGIKSPFIHYIEKQPEASWGGWL